MYIIQAEGVDTLSIIVLHILNITGHVTSHIIALPGPTYALMKKI